MSRPQPNDFDLQGADGTHVRLLDLRQQQVHGEAQGYGSPGSHRARLMTESAVKPTLVRPIVGGAA